MELWLAVKAKQALAARNGRSTLAAEHHGPPLAPLHPGRRAAARDRARPRAATSGTPRATGTSTPSRRSTASTSATGPGRRSPRPREAADRAAALLHELGRVRARRPRSSSPTSSPSSCRSTSAASSSSAAAPRRSRRRSRSRGSTTACAASRRATSSSRAAAPTTGRRSGPSRSTAAPRCARSSSRSCPGACAPRCRTATAARTARREPGCTLRCADEIDDIVQNEGPETVAAVILEPVQNSAGSIAPPPGYFERVREICDAHGLLLVADEVICGFGRVGDWFGSTRYGIEPDLMTMAKGITSAYAPLGAVVARRTASSRSSPSRRRRSRTGSRSAATRSRARSRSPTSTSSSGRT